MNYMVGNWSKAMGIEVALDSYNFLFIVAELTVFLLVGIYSLSYFQNEKRNKFFILILLMHTGLLGGFLSRDLFNYFVLMEIAYVSTFIMVGLSGGLKAKKAAFRYLIFSFMASYLFLLSIGIIYLKTGYLNLELIGSNLEMTTEIKIAVGMAFSSLILKAGIFPLYFWLPDAHSIPNTPVSALLSGVSIKGPVYGLVLFTVFFPTEHLLDVLLILAFISIFFGVILGLRQINIKRLLAYSTVSQMGFVMIGIATLNIYGAIYYSVAHAIVKSGLFLAAGSLVDKDGTTDMKHLSYRKNYAIMVAVIALSLGISGIWPSIGSFAKSCLASELSGIWKVLFYGGGIATLLLMFKMNYYLWTGHTERTALFVKKDGGLNFNWLTKSTIPLLSAVLALGVGYVLLGDIKVLDYLYLVGAGAVFLTMVKTDLLEWDLPKGIKDISKKVGTTNNFFAMIYMLTMLIFLIESIT
ncbi:MAG: proton-conducting transporter membrane subunit [Candidatus Aenigmatarchaeota archaeon]